MIKQKLVIGNNEKTILSTYIRKEPCSSGKKPIVIVCPGGGFLDCSPFEGECVALRFYEEGYHAAVLTYSTEASAPGKSAFPRPLYDLAEAIKFIREQADEWGVDTNKIIILGFSAGANLCGLYGDYWNKSMMHMIGDPDMLRPNAAILCYPMLDLRAHLKIFELEEREGYIDLHSVIGKNDTALGLMDFWKRVNRAQFGHDYPTDQEIRDYSPIFQVSKNVPPTFIWHTFSDPLLTPIQSLEYAKALYENNIPCELHIYEKGKHGLSLADRTSAKKEADINEHIATWVILAIQWLNELFQDE